MREQILSEIKRLAAMFGAPPGQGKFESETGIRSQKWRGVYWARWSDALREAGFEPNLKQERFVTEDILEKVATACRHYECFASIPELKLYRRSNPSFPSYSTIENHFPRRQDLLGALTNYVSTKAGFEDVVSLLPAISDHVEPLMKEGSEGFVYLLKSGNYYKIGRSDEIERRVKQITVALPESVSLVHSIRTDDPAGIEAYWHRRFESLRANGEWFRLGANELKAFRRRSYQ